MFSFCKRCAPVLYCRRKSMYTKRKNNRMYRNQITAAGRKLGFAVRRGNMTPPEGMYHDERNQKTYSPLYGTGGLRPLFPLADAREDRYSLAEHRQTGTGAQTTGKRGANRPHRPRQNRLSRAGWVLPRYFRRLVAGIRLCQPRGGKRGHFHPALENAQRPAGG